MSRDYKVLRFLKSTENALPRNVQEIVVRKKTRRVVRITRSWMTSSREVKTVKICS